MEVRWNILRITVPYNIGNLNEKKIDVLINKLNENGMKVSARVNSPNGVIFVLGEGKDNLILSSDQFTFISTIGDNEFKWEEKKEKIKVVLDTFLIDDSLKYVFNVEGNSDTEDSHKESCTTYLKNSNGDIPRDTFGVGYRFLIKNNDFQGEYKIEPMINDKRKWYYQLILNTNNNETLEHVIENIEKEIEERFNIK